MTQDDFPEKDRAWILAVRDAAAAWAAEAPRELPWRSERDPYRVLVSEMMLIQTTVTAVVPYYLRFLERFPDVGKLAEAREEDVLKVWEGLGYYRRARQLQAAARLIAAEYSGRFPADRAALLALPGVGRYIAGAVLSFAFDRPEPILEANTQRLLARLVGLSIPLKEGIERLWDVAARLVPRESPGKFNQALMDLGSMVCLPQTPTCLVCPLKAVCRAWDEGAVGAIPACAPRAVPTAGFEAAVLAISTSGGILVVRRPQEGLWAGFWELPTVHVRGANPAGRSEGSSPETRLATIIRRLVGREPRVGPALHRIRYAVTRYKMEIETHIAHLPDAEAGPGGIDQEQSSSVRWVSIAEAKGLAFSSPGRRILKWAEHLKSGEILRRRIRRGPLERQPIRAGDRCVDKVRRVPRAISARSPSRSSLIRGCLAWREFVL